MTARSQDDKLNLDDLREIEEALFIFQIGWARGRLHRVSERITAAMDDARSFICPGCGAVSYNPHDIEARYCGRCHQFGDDDAP